MPITGVSRQVSKGTEREREREREGERETRKAEALHLKSESLDIAKETHKQQPLKSPHPKLQFLSNPGACLAWARRDL